MHEEGDDSIKQMVGRLAADSSRLVTGEVRLARLEIDEAAQAASRGVAAIASAFGIAVIAAAGTTCLLAMLVGHLAGQFWIGAVSVGVMQLVIGAVLVRRGRVTLGH